MGVMCDEYCQNIEYLCELCNQKTMHWSLLPIDIKRKIMLLVVDMRSIGTLYGSIIKHKVALYDHSALNFLRISYDTHSLGHLIVYEL